MRFQMVGARAAILSGPAAQSLEQLIQAIENACVFRPIVTARFGIVTARFGRL